MRTSAQLKTTLRPPDWCKAFRNQNDIEVDLGCGRGHYAWERAVSHPEVNVVALEVKKKWTEKLRAQAKKACLSNLRVIRCDVTQDLPLLFGNSTITGITIHHPDPWWKKRHKKRSFIQPHMLDCVAHILKPEGFIFLQTDVPDLADQMQTLFSNHDAFRPVDAVYIQRQRMGAVRSHRETKCMEKGIPVYRLSYLRKPPDVCDISC